MTILDSNRLEKEIAVFGSEIFRELEQPKRSLLDTERYTELLLSLGMQDENLKVSLFRFVDVLASLSNSAAIIRHVQEYFEPVRDRIPEPFRRALGINPGSLAAKPVALAIKKMVSFVASHFIVGENPKAALKALQKIRAQGQAFTVDLLGETTSSEEEGITYLERYRELLTTLSTEVPRWSEAKPLIKDHRGEETPINISVKLSALYSQAKPLNTGKTIEVFAERLGAIAQEAKRIGAFVYVDMEDASLTSITLQAFKSLFQSPEFRDYPRVGIVLQAYLRRTEQDLEELLAWLRVRETPIAVRLVKGAYWDSEVISSRQNQWPVPVWQQKQNSDANYEKLSLTLLKNHERILPAFASHNIRSLAHAVKAAELLNIPNTQYELQTLYGMGDPIKKAFRSRGYLVREYAPVGELLPGMGYLVRRLLENTSNEGFLRLSVHEHVSPLDLLKRPLFDTNDTGTEHIIPPSSCHSEEQFVNCPPIDFTVPDERQKILAQLFAQKGQSAKEPRLIRPILNGKSLSSQLTAWSHSPEDPSLILAKLEFATQDMTRDAIQSLHEYFPTWRGAPLSERTQVLRQAAEMIEERRAEFTAAIILEAGKSWGEADADVAEAIDFLRYYALQAERLFHVQHLGKLAGEVNTYFYEARGVTSVICPWNFPLAIPCGMFAAAIVTGNCAILKPAEQTSLIAALLFETFLQAGLPKEAAAFLPGYGEEIGPLLVEHPQVATVVFTGSKEVGLHLVRTGAESSSRATHVKRVIAEMGGKNAIIVDDDADLDEAIKGIVHSAFGFQGQKCSACSRAIVVGEHYEKFARRLVSAIESLPLGAASDPATVIGPVIDKESQQRILQLIRQAESDCTLLCGGSEKLTALEGKPGYFIPPTLFANIPPEHPLLKQEIFGPVLALEHAASFEAAVRLANSSEYGLTGAIFSRSPQHIDYAFREFRVGNLYINRGSTGAMVMRQPFGGAKMSGVGSKAGGPDYLLQFVLPRVVTENTLRRGFAPGIDKGSVS